MKYTAIILVWLLFLSGCATTPNYAKKHAQAGDYNYTPSRSKALNVAVATGLTQCDEEGCAPLSDVPRDKLPASMQNMSNVEIMDAVTNALVIGKGIGQMVGAIGVITGLGNIAGGLMSLGTLFIGPSHLANPATQGFFIAWMPKSMAGSPAEARKLMGRILFKAAPRQFPGRRHMHVKKFAEGAGTKVTFCDDNNKDCWIPNVAVYVWENKPSVARQPDWLGGEPAYVWQNWPAGAYEDYGNGVIGANWARTEHGMPVTKMRAYFRAWSANLPKWVYIYMPPVEGHVSYPVMFHRGKALLFIEPKRTAF